MPHRQSLFGSLVWWELVRLARRCETSRSRILLLYLLLLAIALFTLWWSSPSSLLLLLRGIGDPLSLGRMSVDQKSVGRFTESLAFVLFAAQLLFVAIVTPAYAASAVSGEKDRQTLPLLLTTELSDREIVWGKTFARMIFILSAISAGIPLLLLLLFFGGVSFELIAACYALLFGTTFLSAAVGAYLGCTCPDTQTAIVRTYTFPVAFVTVSSFIMLGHEFGMEGPYHLKLDTPALQLGVGLAYAMIQGAAGLALLTLACHKLRTHEPTAGTLEQTAYPEPPRGRPTPMVFGPPTVAPRPLPPLNVADPVLWKERHVARIKLFPIFNTPAQWLGGTIAFLAALLFVVGAWQMLTWAVRGLNPDDAHQFSQQGLERPPGGGWLIMAGLLAAGLYLFHLTVGVTGCVAGERSRKTLDSLLMTLLPRRSILWSKVRAHMEGRLVFGVGSVTAIGCGFGAEWGIAIGFAAMAAMVAGFWFTTACGAWLSVRCPTHGRAFRLCLLPVVLTLALPIRAWDMADRNNIEPTIAALSWTTAILAVLGCLIWWRAVIELKRGE